MSYPSLPSPLKIRKLEKDEKNKRHEQIAGIFIFILYNHSSINPCSILSLQDRFDDSSIFRQVSGCEDFPRTNTSKLCTRRPGTAVHLKVSLHGVVPLSQNLWNVIRTSPRFGKCAWSFAGPMVRNIARQTSTMSQPWASNLNLQISQTRRADRRE